MNRDAMIPRLQEPEPWDFVVIGGGATGLGVAIDAASRGYRTLLLEQHDFGKGTSSRSTKLVHGGVRYLKQGNISLVIEALKERGLLLRNAPHLVHDLPFVVPTYDWWEGPFYGIGLKMYDLLAGKQGFGRSKVLSRDETIEAIPTVEPHGLQGGVRYCDGQFDDARLIVHMAMTAAEQGAAVLNYVEVVGLITENRLVHGVRAWDVDADHEYEVRAKVVVNATGVYTDRIRRMDAPFDAPMIAPSQGVHIVLDHDFLPGDSAIMVPKTDDGRVLFAIPWLGRVVVGTTDTPVRETPLEPRPLDVELDFLLEHAARYLTKDPEPADVRSAFAGLRPLVRTGDANANTAALSRDHTVHISNSGLVTVTGGKWTTYRKMAEDAVDHAAVVAGLDERPCVTSDLQLHGYHRHASQFGDLARYGSDAPEVKDLIASRAGLDDRLHPDHGVVAGEVEWAARQEMARTVEDFLARRTRLLLLDARASMEIAPRVAELLAGVLGRDGAWQADQVKEYRNLATRYLLA